ncbi:M64 family metallopeptidase [Tahibacter harae]|uniref:M64 family metallopeptidase n=1 Tax=Tahibacter harae TaxID=2963937 RepID=A0ABT1QRV8_9GAMM|nr:M64 family metallopeptidase [Tahibacter harae]MCQ4164991.1 M64 family metallopeptidase [Tahibacter harae]
MRKLWRRGLGMAALCSCAPVLAEPAHYIVFALDSQDRAQAVFYAQVELADGAARAATLDGGSGNSGTDRFLWQGLRKGEAAGGGEIRVPRQLRVEHGNAGETALQHLSAEDPHRAFVLRLPLAQADTLELVGDRQLQRFDLGQLAATASTLPLASVQPARLLQAQRSGSSTAAANSGNRLDVLLIGDGYTAAEQTTFATHANALHTAMFNVSPYKEYASFVNWQPGFVASSQSGADHPPYQAGCTSTSCCADPAAQTDPRAGTFVSTALDSTFCTAQIHRTLFANSSKVFAAAVGFPDWDKILVTVNDPVYGGAGGSFAVLSAHALAPSIVIHEFGHSFTGLADEYTTPYPGFPACSDLGVNPGCEANVTNQTNASLVKWRSWFTPGIQIPTPAGTAGLGLFAGARYLSAGMYRPTENQCLMNALGANFCAVCRQEYVRKLYRGGFGVPAGGIDLIEPGSEYPPAAAPVHYAQGTQRSFGAALLRPSVGNIGLQWYLDGNPVATTESYTFQQLTPTPATRTLELRVTDQTALVQPAMAGDLLTHSRTWTIQVGNDRLFDDGFQ